MATLYDEREVYELIEKQKLYENMMTYCRGMDRKDVELMKSTYWPDATDDHGAFVGNGHEFCEWAYQTQKKTGHVALHHCGNTLTELMGDRAKRETVFMYVKADTDPPQVCLLSGRYRDLCEKRCGEWKVLRRVCVFDWAKPLPGASDFKAIGMPDTTVLGAVYPHDPIYLDW
jgi:hypothetical protein